MESINRRGLRKLAAYGAVRLRIAPAFEQGAIAGGPDLFFAQLPTTAPSGANSLAAPACLSSTTGEMMMADYRIGRVVLHLMCILRGSDFRMHMAGVVRELQGAQEASGAALKQPGHGHCEQ